MSAPTIVVFDLETTGVDVETCRIVSISAIVFGEDIKQRQIHFVLNPGVPIPPESTAIHGITDGQVANKPKFRDAAPEIEKFFAGVDIVAGYNIRGFDLLVLQNEFARAGIYFETPKRIIDCLNIFRNDQPRDLSAAVKFYVGRDMAKGAHDSIVDATETRSVLIAQMSRRSIEELEEISTGDAVDLMGKIKRNANGEPCLAFGKYAGSTLAKTAQFDPGYLRWIVNGSNFPEDTKREVKKFIPIEVKK